ncbi:Fe-S cluster assembly sulfur transfer protein SufU [Serinibacter salmoneus]|uniref:Nitrogen fixation NifU-like protein n=1 Tax=Serinibacter salmoneus TaxID=556530 RepID=A0A2A9CYF3_9MICO|nr:SUF system NifU family Fe-S cluster assembly protein [Serinibacter salmoneus]PFG19468.1 nitrogen fixation NifU-like protein [Serinibacter salmoneus]
MAGLDQLYQQVILDHARARTGSGLIAAEGEMVGESFQVNPTCGDEVRLRVRLEPAAGGGAPRIAELGWEGVGCSISQASLSVLAELVDGVDVRRAEDLGETFRALMHNRGKPLTDQAAEEDLGDGAAFVGVAQFPARIKCALLGWMALRDAVAHALVGGAPDEDSTGRVQE